MSGAALMRRLTGYWSSEGDAALETLGPFLAVLREQVVESRPEQPARRDLPEYVYPLF